MFIKQQNNSGIVEVTGMLTIRAIGFKTTSYNVYLESANLREHMLGTYGSRERADAILDEIATAMNGKEPIYRMPEC